MTERIAHIEKLQLSDSGVVDHKTGRKVVLPAHSKFVHDGRRVVKIVPSTQSVSSTFANGTTQLTYVIDSSAVASCRMLCLRLQTSVSGSTSRLLPTPYWFQRIELWYRGSGTSYLQRWFPETLMTALGLRPPSDVISLAKSMGFNPMTMWAGEPHGVGVSKYYHLWLPMFYETGLGLNGKLDGGGTQFELRIFPAGGIVASGGGTVSINQLDLLIDSDLELTLDEKAHMGIVREVVQAGIYADPVQIINASQTWNASTQYDIDLTQLSGKCAALLLAVGPSAGATGAAANFAVMNYLSLDGSGSSAGTIDVVGPTGQPITTGGSPFEVGYWKQHIGSRFFNHQFLRNTNILPIVFARNLEATAFHGVVDDYLQLDGSQYRLRVNTPASGTSEVQTLTQSGTPASGTYRLGWTDPVSGLTSWTADLAYNTSAANMKVAFEALESVIQAKILVTFSAAASAGAAFTATFTNFAGQACDLGGNMIQMLSQTATSAPANVAVTITRTTVGVPGWLNGTYSINVFGLMLRVAKKSGGGYLVTDTI